MPYKTNKELPPRVKNNLPQGAQTIYRKAFNNAFMQYKTPSSRRYGGTREEAAHRVAWAAVKNVYKKKGDKWVKR
ncbi:ChaB family protein [Candidatus Woesearchaeota archaeon]|nr:ChaB family protein [Candidatus Woesearchaeota archaeon]